MVDVSQLLGTAAEHLSVRRSFGAAYEKDGTMVIPVAFVAGGGGGGGGEMPAHASTSDGERAGGDGDLSGGAGGGFGGVVIPLGVYVINGDDARWVPALNMTRVALAGLGLVRLVLKALLRSTTKK